MTDVPGHTRGLIAPLAAHGVKFLDIGVNDASTPAQVPPFFLWKDPGGATLAVMYHHGYGAVARVPNSELAIAMVVRGDYWLRRNSELRMPSYDPPSPS